MINEFFITEIGDNYVLLFCYEGAKIQKKSEIN